MIENEECENLIKDILIVVENKEFDEFEKEFIVSERYFWRNLYDYTYTYKNEWYIGFGHNNCMFMFKDNEVDLKKYKLIIYNNYKRNKKIIRILAK